MSARSDRRLILSDGMPLAVQVGGCGVPLVLLHGFPLDHSMWEGQWPLTNWGRLLAGGSRDGSARLVVPDLRGFGGSVGGPPPTSMAGLADDVAEVIAGLEIDEPVVVCGLSMGGYVAQHLAVRHPGLLRGLVLVDTRLEADSEQVRAVRADLSARVGRLGARIAAEAMVTNLLAGQTEARHRQLADSLRRVIESTETGTIQATLSALADRPDMTTPLSSIDLPTLLIVGSEDTITPPACLERAAAIIPAARLVVMPRCGHMTPLEDPANFNALLAGFLRDVTGR